MLTQLLQSKQQKLIQQFQQDIQKAVPEVAKDQQLDLVAVQVVYQKPQTEIVDLTETIIEQINDGAEPAAPAPQPAP